MNPLPSSFLFFAVLFYLPFYFVNFESFGNMAPFDVYTVRLVSFIDRFVFIGVSISVVM